MYYEGKILEAVNEMTEKDFTTLEEAEKEYSKEEIFGMWLNYEGIIGYDYTILSVLKTLGIVEWRKS